LVRPRNSPHGSLVLLNGLSYSISSSAEPSAARVSHTGPVTQNSTTERSVAFAKTSELLNLPYKLRCPDALGVGEVEAGKGSIMLGEPSVTAAARPPLAVRSQGLAKL